MSLFRQQALEQRHLPEPMFTPVTVVRIGRWLWVALITSLLVMLLVWLIFSRVYTTYETTVSLTDAPTVLTLPAEIIVTSPVRAIAHCERTIQGTAIPLSDHTVSLQFEAPVQGECRVTLLLNEESPLDRLRP